MDPVSLAKLKSRVFGLQAKSVVVIDGVFLHV